MKLKVYSPLLVVLVILLAVSIFLNCWLLHEKTVQDVPENILSCDQAFSDDSNKARCREKCGNNPSQECIQGVADEISSNSIIIKFDEGAYTITATDKQTANERGEMPPDETEERCYKDYRVEIFDKNGWNVYERQTWTKMSFRIVKPLIAVYIDGWVNCDNKWSVPSTEARCMADKLGFEPKQLDLPMKNDYYFDCKFS